MNCYNLGILSVDEGAKEKFVLLEDGALLFGQVMYHKDLVYYYCGEEKMKVLAAGTLPDKNLEDMDSWGWKSTGYEVTTEEKLKPVIVREIIEHKEKDKT